MSMSAANAGTATIERNQFNHRSWAGAAIFPWTSLVRQEDFPADIHKSRRGLQIDRTFRAIKEMSSYSSRTF